MRGDHDTPDDRLERKARSQAIEQVRADTQFTVALATLSLLTCATAFMVVYGHWGI